MWLLLRPGILAGVQYNGSYCRWDMMRHFFSRQAGRALFSTVPRALIVSGLLVAYGLAGWWAYPCVPEWMITLVGLLLFAFLIYLGGAWLDRDILRQAQHPEDD